MTNGTRTSARPSMGEMMRVFHRIGWLSFGGPAGQIALMHRELVETRRWLDEKSYLSALNFCMLLPGPEAMQLATYAGWRLHGVSGGLVAGLLFVLPGALLILALGFGYAVFGQAPSVEALFLGIKAAVLAIVMQALARVARRSLVGRLDWVLAGAAFAGLFLFAVPFPIIVAAAFLIGFVTADRTEADVLGVPPPTVPLSRTLRTVAVWLAIWILPLVAVALVFGPTHVLTTLALLYSKLAVVTFGGAYAVLTFMSQQIVEGYGWLTAGEMLDALGLAETTPGPLILVGEFVGLLAAWRHGGGPPMLMGFLGAMVALWATFVPCFLWIFAGAPYIERITHEPRVAGALRAVTAAVVGVIFNLALWFAIHVLFSRVERVEAWPLSVGLPDLTSLNVVPAVLCLLAAVLLIGRRRGLVETLAVCGLLSLGWSLIP
ncbi:chromate efflux transporter [Hyphomicrobium sp.]|uniref:chromate efflux transporter n=1 Tax=Hyphomicrobium sp. TaxID=82 RepID=UPI002B645BE0|nr:chromate efflux transporter [Hyphomicrobium sp.]HRN89335.1 chromate efflux transporter [Hyphomicrobium sp.]HRQ26416.1 chromate efflux transporter [Hyphomicrobium sp.]